MKLGLRNITAGLKEKIAGWVELKACGIQTGISRFLSETAKDRVLAEDSYERAMRRSLATKPFLKTDGRYLSREQADFRSSLRSKSLPRAC